jgi:hypothetical protein
MCPLIGAETVPEEGREVIEDRPDWGFMDAAKSVFDSVMNPDETLPSGGVVGAAIGALGVAAKGKLKAEPFFSATAKAVETAPLPSAPASQWLGTIKNTPGIKQEELDWIGVEDWLKGQKGPVTKSQISDFVRSNKVDVQEVVKGEMKFAPSKYNLPEVRRAIQQAGDNPGELELTLANDGDAYRALTQRFPELAENEDWASIVANDVYRGDTRPPDTTKFSDPKWQLPGGENYRELLLTLPPKLDAKGITVKSVTNQSGSRNILIHDAQGNEIGGATGTRLTDEEHIKKALEQRGEFRSGHYDEPNVLAHVRFNDRLDAQGKKTLFIEEIQSDWHQKGRKQGYRGAPVKADIRYEPQVDAKYPWRTYIEGNFLTGHKVEAEAKTAAIGHEGYWKGNRVPDAPFKTSWPELSLKRMVKWAADNGYDQIAWTPGKVQAARYDLSKQVDAIQWSPIFGSLRVKQKGSDAWQFIKGEGVTKDNLAEYVGKEAAEKIVALPDTKDPFKGISGADLQVGGEGMAGFYDRILPAAANKLGKKYGAKVGVTKVDNPEKGGSGMFGVYRGEEEVIPAIYGSAADARAVARQRGMAGSEGYTIREGRGEPSEEVWSLPITDAMRTKATEEGFPLFSAAPIGLLPLGAAIHDYFEQSFAGPPEADALLDVDQMQNVGRRPE